MKSDILCLQETQMNFFPDGTLLAKKHHYMSAFCIHGVLTCCTQNLVIEKLDNYTTSCIEATIRCFQVDKTIGKLENVYISPRTLPQKLYSFLHSMLEDIHQNEHIVIVSDFNFDML